MRANEIRNDREKELLKVKPTYYQNVKTRFVTSHMKGI